MTSRAMLFKFSFFRRFRRIYRAWIQYLTLSITLLLVWDVLELAWLSGPPQRVAVSSKAPESQERYFIASIHWNNEAILRSRWNAAVLDLVAYLGAQNVFVAILESGSWDDSKGALRELDGKLTELGVPHLVRLEENTHIDEISRVPGPREKGWIWTPRDRKELRRIPFLAGLRNEVMAQMKAGSRNGTLFTKVLWLNDVVFTTEDIVTLLSTRAGNYAAACSLDFSKPPLYYDTFALRDIGGHKPVTQTWPFFYSSRSRHTMMSNSPIPVQSCWNGMVAMDAAPFYHDTHPLAFRGISDSLAELHLEGSECCLIHTDNPLSRSKGVWMNPNVRVGYNSEAYNIVNPTAPITWPTASARVMGVWGNRWARWKLWLPRMLEWSVVKWRVNRWLTGGLPESERAMGNVDEMNCLINEMQVLIENGWKHL